MIHIASWLLIVIGAGTIFLSGVVVGMGDDDNKHIVTIGWISGLVFLVCGVLLWGAR